MHESECTNPAHSVCLSKDPLKIWVHKLDVLVTRKYGMSFHDMPDCFFWRDLYEDDISPEDALEACEVEWADHDPSFAAVYYGGEE